MRASVDCLALQLSVVTRASKETSNDCFPFLKDCCLMQITVKWLLLSSHTCAAKSGSVMNAQLTASFKGKHSPQSIMAHLSKAVAVRDGEKRGTEPAEIARPAASWLTPGGVHHRNDHGYAGWEGNSWDRGWQIILEFSWPSSLPCWGPGHRGMARSTESTNTGQGSFPPEPDSALQTKALLRMQR